MVIPVIKTDLYSYDLPDEKIAFQPVEPRDESKLLIYEPNKPIVSLKFKNIYQYLPSGSMLLFNNTKVVPARLIFKNKTGAIIEIFYLEPNGCSISDGLSKTGNITINAYVGNFKKWNQDTLIETISIHNKIIDIQVKYIQKLRDYFLLNIIWNDEEIMFSEILDALGQIPLPPYIKRKSNETDKFRYQTTFAKTPGSVAAPTAALHVTPEVIDSLKQKNISLQYITLHVGAGTFKPLKAELVSEHPMHYEHVEISKETIQAYLKNNHYVTCVGTTTLRAFESLYWLGVKFKTMETTQQIEHLVVHQWDPYQPYPNIPVQESFENILNYLETNRLLNISFTTGIMIVPGYSIKTTHALVTNFHQPKSTLLLLIAALVGDQWKDIYRYALEHNFRFLSYGDSCLLRFQ